jgi:hypothetical protein
MQKRFDYRTPGGARIGALALIAALAHARPTHAAPQQVPVSGIGQVESLGTFGSALYMGARPNGPNPARLMRSTDGATFVVTGAGMTIGNPRTLITFGTSLYLLGDNSANGRSAVWRSSDGQTFTAVVLDGFGSANNLDIPGSAIFQNQLFVGTRNKEGGTLGTGGEVWRSSDGVTFTASATGGFGDANNSRVLCLAVLDNRLFAGTRNDTEGAHLYASSDGVSWQKIVGAGVFPGAGFGNATSTTFKRATVFGGALYVGIGDRVSSSTLLWRSTDGVTWSPVSDGLLSGNAANTGIESLAVLGARLYVGTANASQGAEVWSTADGSAWQRDAQSGFGQPSVNVNARALATFGGVSYVGTGNDLFGSTSQGQLWKLDTPGAPASRPWMLVLLASAMAWVGIRRWRAPE